MREASRSVQCKKVRSFAKSSLGSIGPCTEEGAPDMKKTRARVRFECHTNFLTNFECQTTYIVVLKKVRVYVRLKICFFWIFKYGSNVRLERFLSD